MKYPIYVICLFWVLTSIAVSQNPKPSVEERVSNTLGSLGLEGEQNIEYRFSEENRTSFDIIYPKNQIYEKAPVLIFFHGGGYVNGSKNGFYNKRPVIKAITEAGIAIVTVNYRLIRPDNAIRMNQVNEDCKDALRFLAQNAERFGIDRHKFITWGSSAGGSLALMTAFTKPDYLPGAVRGDDIDHTVIGAAVYFGATSFFEETGVWEGRRRPINPLIFERNNGLSEDEVRAMTSPDRHLTSEAPPLLLFYGDKDYVVPVENGRYLNQLAQAKGVDVSYYEIKNADHSLKPVGGETSMSWAEVEALLVDYVLKWVAE